MTSSTVKTQSTTWCFTFNNYTEDDVERLKSTACCSSEPGEPRPDGALEVRYLVAGREVGESGTPHLQGFVWFPTKRRLKAVSDFIGGNAHVEVCRCVPSSIKYCKKDQAYFEIGTPSATRGKRSDLDKFKDAVRDGCYDLRTLREEFSIILARYPRFCRDYIDDHRPQQAREVFPLRPWQAELSEALKRDPCSRKITFVVDVEGNKGKTWFAHYYASLHKRTQVLLPGKKADMAWCLEEDVRVLFMDAPRSKQGEFIQYDFLEDVKNGYVFSSKYESRMKYFGKVHVVVLMNEYPDMRKLSQDRYDIISI